MAKRLVLEFPAELPENAPADPQLLRTAKEGVVIELLRRHQISQGRAVELLGLTYWDLHDLMAKYGVPVADFSPEELQQQREDAPK